MTHKFGCHQHKKWKSTSYFRKTELSGIKLREIRRGSAMDLWNSTWQDGACVWSCHCPYWRKCDSRSSLQVKYRMASRQYRFGVLITIVPGGCGGFLFSIWAVVTLPRCHLGSSLLVFVSQCHVGITIDGMQKVCVFLCLRRPHTGCFLDPAGDYLKSSCAFDRTSCVRLM